MRSGEDELWRDARFSSELQCSLECASADFTALQAASGNGGRAGEGGTGGQLRRGGGAFCEWDVSPGLWEGGRALWGRRVLCVGSKRPRAALHCRVADTVFRECRDTGGDTFWV